MRQMSLTLLVMKMQHTAHSQRYVHVEDEKKLFNLYFDRETFERVKKNARKKKVSLSRCILELSKKYCESQETAK
ncbi:Hypothetical protein PYTT_1604 [Akkermansia glycaniphila]|uniref:Ribbon-helix-helix protein CopG domain-containing protein n=2 Tax=Akkermansia glycaniphila TaxID=1679444 RepID=A0A1C7PCY8_9BACT|nr:hypothetical protein AC781_04990 [Akkermansia glycaniphila]SEH90700.1 Hypothetical protein PYTT_1604 [Akkermansia glycaniphila]